MLQLSKYFTNHRAESYIYSHLTAVFTFDIDNVGDSHNNKQMKIRVVSPMNFSENSYKHIHNIFFYHAVIWIVDWVFSLWYYNWILFWSSNEKLNKSKWIWVRTKLINYMSVLCPSPFSDNITNIGLEIRINVYCKHITFEVLYPENNQLMVGSVQSENLTMHLVSMLVRGRAVAAVSSSCTAECGTLTWTVDILRLDSVDILRIH